jgi:hypothetical protein
LRLPFLISYSFFIEYSILDIGYSFFLFSSFSLFRPKQHHHLEQLYRSNGLPMLSYWLLRLKKQNIRFLIATLLRPLVSNSLFLVRYFLFLFLLYWIFNIGYWIFFLPLFFLLSISSEATSPPWMAVSRGRLAYAILLATSVKKTEYKVSLFNRANISNPSNNPFPTLQTILFRPFQHFQAFQFSVD